MRCVSLRLATIQKVCRSVTARHYRGSGLRGLAVYPSASSSSRATTNTCLGSALRAAPSFKHMQEHGPGQTRRMQATIGQGALNSPIEELHVKELQEILERISQDDADDVQLIDVREDFEHQTASLPGFKLMPMSRLQEWAQDIHEEMDPEKETVLLCHHGVRSMRVAGFLASQGFQNLKNVTGGIDAYSKEVDSSVPQY